MKFRYRYVRFGTRFTHAEGIRTERSLDPGRLHENELALDVGGVAAARPDDVDLRVVDHHFHRDSGQFPSAAAAVLHVAPRIADHFGKATGDVWLVAHEAPDFDAFCSMFLARRVIEAARTVSEGATVDDSLIPFQGWDLCGLRPDGWRLLRNGDGGETSIGEEIDWFDPALRDLPNCRRWPVLLAAVASCVDNGRRLACPKNRALHSVLYAALKRGRDYEAEASGAVEFFREVMASMADAAQLLNPLTDSVLEQSRTFAPELALLDHEVSAYQRDMQRARRVVVFLRESKDPYRSWFPVVQRLPLLNPEGSLSPEHLLQDQRGDPGGWDLPA